MQKQSKKSIVLFIFLKYIVFFIFLMVLRNDYSLFSGSFLGVLGYFMVFMLPLPALIALIFTFPLFFAFRLKKFVFFIPAVIGILAFEYLVYTGFASTENLTNGLYNGLISVILGLIYFGIKNRFTPSKKDNNQ